MRAILLILILAVVGLIAAIQTGLVDFSQTRSAALPSVATSDGQVRTSGGQTPAFDVQTGSVAVGRGETNVAVPRIKVERGATTVGIPKIEVRPAGNNAQPAPQPAPAPAQ